MTHTPFPRTLASATGDVQAKAAPRQRRSADQDLGFRIRNDLARALGSYPITAKHVAVLSGLISFLGEHPRVVFASNSKLRARLHNIPERTLSRLVKLLVEEGFLRRIMSPNGKRWVRRDEDGIIEEAFGLDLTPFFERSREFAERAMEALRREAAIKAARLQLSLLCGRLEALGAAPDLVEEIRRERRRVPCPATLERLDREARVALADLGQVVDNSTQASCGSEEMAGNDSHSGRHLQTRNDRIFSTHLPQPTSVAEDGDEGSARRLGGDARLPQPEPVRDGAPSESGSIEAETSEPPPSSGSEPPQENVRDHANRILADLRRKLTAQTKPSLHGPGGLGGHARGAALVHGQAEPQDAPSRPDGAPQARPEPEATGRPPAPSAPTLPLPELTAVLDACPDSLSLAGERPRNWSQLFEAAWRIGRWIGIPDTILAEACAALGRDGLAITLFALGERQASLRQPAAYLRALCRRSGFHPSELIVGPKARTCPA